MELFDPEGNRKYLTASEHKIFGEAARSLDDKIVRTFCLMLLYSGCRISEAFNVLVKGLDYGSGGVIFETLKKRKKSIYRQEPLPSTFLNNLNLVFDLKLRQKANLTIESRIPLE